MGITRSRQTLADARRDKRRRSKMGTNEDEVMLSILTSSLWRRNKGLAREMEECQREPNGYNFGDKEDEKVLCCFLR